MADFIVSSVFHFFRGLGIWGAFLSMVIENIGIPLPTEIGYLIGQDLINQKIHSYPFILFILTLGHLLGSMVSYSIGRYGKKMVKTKFKRNKKLTEVQEKLEEWYKKYGNFTVFLTRFIGYVRPWSSFVAGFAEVKPWPFVLWTALGALIFNTITLYFSGVFLLIWRRYSAFHVLFIIISTFLFFGLIIYESISYFRAKRDKKTLDDKED